MSMDFTPVQKIMDHFTSWRIPGNAIVIYHKGKEVFRYASGYADVENKVPMTADHFMNIYSCSKVSTVVAAMQLYEQGKFQLQDPLSEYMPEFTQMTVRQEDGSIVPAKTPITIRQLFTMTAGFDYDLDTPGRKNAEALTQGHMNTREVWRCMAKDPLTYEPGTKFVYSKGHDLLAALVEEISGEKFRDYVQNHIFAPLGIEGYYHITPEIEAKMAQQYNFQADGTVEEGIPVKADREIPGGSWTNIGKPVDRFVFGDEYDSGGAGVTTTVAEYVKLADALAMKGVGATGERILSPGAVDLMKLNHLTPQQLRYYDWPRLTGYGYGLGVRTILDKAQAGFMGQNTEFGWCGAAGAMLMADNDAQLGVFYAHHMMNQQEPYYQIRLRNVIYSCLK